MTSFLNLKKRFIELESKAAEFLDRSTLSAIFYQPSTRALVRDLMHELREAIVAVRVLGRALGVKAWESYNKGRGSWFATHIHKESEGRYLKIGEGSVQNSSGVPIVEGDILVVYQDYSGRLWFRPVDEFNDGRFEEVPNAFSDITKSK